MDDQMRQMLDQFNSINNMTRSIQGPWNDAMSHVRDHISLASIDWDRGASLRSAFDALELGRPEGAFASVYQPDILARMNDMAASLQAAVPPVYQLAPRIIEDWADRQRLLGFGQLDALGLAPLRDSYSRLAEFQKSVATQYSGIVSPLEELSPLFSAQARWARVAQIPASLEQTRIISVEASALVGQFLELRSFLNSLPIDLEAEIDEEEAEQALAVANERLAEAFVEKSPAATINKIQEILKAIKSGVLRLAPKAMKIFIVILLSVISNFITDIARPYVFANRSNAPQVVKEIKREVKRIQKEGAPFPSSVRVVVARELVVRRGPGQSAPIVGHLYAADLVWLVKARNQSWSLVEFEDGEGEIALRGWVFSRYILPLRGKGARLRSQKSSDYSDDVDFSAEFLDEP